MPKRRHPRALASALDEGQRPSVEVDGRRYAVRSFSPVGLGVWMPKAPDAGLAPGCLLPGHRLDVRVYIEGEAWQVAAEVRHYANGVLGIEFRDPTEPLLKRLEVLSAPARLADGLELIGEPGAADPQTGHCRLLYADDVGSELVVWFNGAQRLVVALQVRWQGCWVYRALQAPASSGRAREDAPRGQRLEKEHLEHRDSLASGPVLREAARFLSALPSPLPGSLLWQFLETGEQVYLPAAALTKRRAA